MQLIIPLAMHRQLLFEAIEENSCYTYLPNILSPWSKCT